jgi:hypothetical protein
MERLREKIYARQLQDLLKSQEARWMSNKQLERGNPVKVFRQPL